MSRNFLIFLLVTSGYVICYCTQSNSSSLPVFINNSLNFNESNENQLNVLKISKILQIKLNEIRNNELGVSLIQVNVTRLKKTNRLLLLIDFFFLTGNF